MRLSRTVLAFVASVGFAGAAFATPLSPSAGAVPANLSVEFVGHGWGHGWGGQGRHFGYGHGPRRHYEWSRGHHYGWGRGHHYGWRHHHHRRCFLPERYLCR